MLPTGVTVPPRHPVQAAMEAEMEAALARCRAEVVALVEPLEQVGWVDGGRRDALGGRVGVCVGRSPARAPQPTPPHARVPWPLAAPPPCPPTPTLPLPHPLQPEQLAAAEVERLEGAEARRGALGAQLEELQQRVANLQ